MVPLELSQLEKKEKKATKDDQKIKSKTLSEKPATGKDQSEVNQKRNDLAKMTGLWNKDSETGAWDTEKTKKAAEKRAKAAAKTGCPWKKDSETGKWT